MELVHLIGTFPTVVFTSLLALSLIYWLFVIIGAIDIDALGGADAITGAGKGAFEGLAGTGDGAMEGLAGTSKGALEGAVGAAKAAGHADLSLEGSEDAAAGFLSFLKLRRAPVTVVVSLFALFGWLLSTLTVQSIGVPGVLAGLGLLFGASVASLLLTSLAIRPIAPFFAMKGGKKSSSLVGKIAVVSTGEVTATYGQATYEGEGLSVTLQVRSDETVPLKRGDRVVLVDWDQAKHAFTIEKLPSHDDVLLHREALREAEAEVEAALAEDAAAAPKREKVDGP